MKTIKILLAVLVVLMAIFIYVESQPKTIKIQKQFSIEGAYR